MKHRKVCPFLLFHCRQLIFPDQKCGRHQWCLRTSQPGRIKCFRKQYVKILVIILDHGRFHIMTDFCISMTNKFQRDVWHTMEAQKGETWFRFFFLRLRVKRRASSTMVPKDYVPLLSGYKFVRCSKRENEIAELLRNSEANSKQNTKKNTPTTPKPTNNTTNTTARDRSKNPKCLILPHCRTSSRHSRSSKLVVCRRASLQ